MQKWILLIHQIAQDTPNLRVKIWRDLKKYGAVLFKNAVYILPYTKDHEEILQWLCKQIKDSGSDASLFITESLDKKQDNEIVQTFWNNCNKEYHALLEICNDIMGKIGQIEDRGSITNDLTVDFKKHLTEIIKSTEDISRIDFFSAPQKVALSQKIESIQKRLDEWSKKSGKETAIDQKKYQVKNFSGKKWITRKDIHIDRVASAWLIKRFIDLRARFAFVSKGVITEGTIPFDMYGAEFTHQGDDCTFETLIKKFGLHDPALQPIAEIVHEADLKDNKYGRKEADGINQIIIGLRQIYKNDHKILEKGIEIFDALYQYYSSNNKKL